MAACLYGAIIISTPTICDAYFLSRISIFKTLKSILDIQSTTSGLNVVYSRWPPLCNVILREYALQKWRPS